MTKATNSSITSPSRFHNVSNEALADMLGHADAVLKGADAEVKLLKDEYKARGLLEVAGDRFTVTATDSWHGFEVVVISTVIPIKSSQHIAAAA